MNKILNGFISAISFFTVIPFKGSYEINYYTVLFISAVGIITGAIAGIIFYLISNYSSLIAAAFSISFILLIYGFNHLDALADFGDSLMAHGNAEKRQQVIKDRYTGSGGFGLVFVIYLMSVALLSYFHGYYGFLAIIYAEVSSRFIMVFSLYKTKAFGSGLGKTFTSIISDNKIIIIINLLPVLIISIFDVYYILAFVIVFLIMHLLKRQIINLYDGINGDIAGSLGEMGRFLMYFMLFIFLILKIKLML